MVVFSLLKEQLFSESNMIKNFQALLCSVITLASASPVQLKPSDLDLFLLDKCSPSLQLRHENLVTLCRWAVGFT